MVEDVAAFVVVEDSVVDRHVMDNLLKEMVVVVVDDHFVVVEDAHTFVAVSSEVVSTINNK